MTRRWTAGLAIWALSAGLAWAQPPADQLPAQPEPVENGPAVEVAPFPNGTPVSRFREPGAVVVLPSSPSAKPVESTSSCHFPKSDVFAPDEESPEARPWHGEDMEYLLWWLKKGSLPPLVTQSRPGFLPVLGLPNTRVLLGDKQLDQEEHSGGRFTLASPLLVEKGTTMLGLEGTYFFLGTRTANFLANGSSVLGRPFVDANAGQESAYLVAAPGLAAGNVGVSYSARMQGVEMNGVGTLFSTCRLQLDTLIGFRYLEVDEGINIIENLRPVLVSTSFASSDQFDGHNRFYGGQLGARLDIRRGGFFANFLGKVALGESYEVVRINGLTTTTPNGGTATVQPGGLFALSTNSGRFVRESFAVVPEFGVKVGYHCGDHARFFVGYTFLYLSDLSRPGDQIDRVINTAQAPISNPNGGLLVGAARPETTMRSTDFWTHGLSVGMEFRY